MTVLPTKEIGKVDNNMAMENLKCQMEQRNRDYSLMEFSECRAQKRRSKDFYPNKVGYWIS